MPCLDKRAERHLQVGWEIFLKKAKLLLARLLCHPDSLSPADRQVFAQLPMASERRNPFDSPADTPNISRSFIEKDGQPEKSSHLSISVHPVSENGVSNADDENVPSYFLGNGNPAKSSRLFSKETHLHDGRTSWLSRKISMLVEAFRMGHAEPAKVGDPPIGEGRRKHHVMQLTSSLWLARCFVS